jgi:hypothetical protein
MPKERATPGQNDDATPNYISKRHVNYNSVNASLKPIATSPG